MSRTQKRNFSIEKYQKLGCRSIYDIIKIEEDRMCKKEKTDYIRHHYIYYEGSYEVFFDAGHANSNRALLNEVIYRVITGQFLPTVLKIINQAMRQWIKHGKNGMIDLKSVLAEHGYIV